MYLHLYDREVEHHFVSSLVPSSPTAQMKLFLTITMIFMAFLIKAQKVVYVPTNAGGDTTLWYKWQSNNFSKVGIPDLKYTNDSVRFRFSTEIQAVDVWTNDRKIFNGTFSVFTTRPGNGKNGDQQPEAFFGHTWNLDTGLARSVFSLFEAFKIAAIRPQDSIEGWQNGLDGEQLTIEYSTPAHYSFKTYWTPDLFRQKLPEAFLIDSFSRTVQRAVEFSERFYDFLSTLPEGCYRVGSYFVTCNNEFFQKVKRSKKRRNG